MEVQIENTPINESISNYKTPSYTRKAVAKYQEKNKEKCKKYPYCNQGDIRSLEFFEEDGLVESAKNVSNKTGIPYGIIEKLILNEINEYLLSK